MGAGILKYLNFHISANAKPCMCCALWFDYIRLYDPEDPLEVCYEGGEVCVDHCDVYGRVTAWFCRYDCGRMYWWFPLPEARVHLSQCGEAIATTYTNDSGLFEFECLWPLDDQGLTGDCGYCIDIDYCRMPDVAITAFDAALILKYLVCYDDLDCCRFYACGQDWYPQRIAADVNCTSVITAYDASLILQYAVGLLPAFPCPDPWVWINVDCTWCSTRCPMDYDIVGIYKGDVSGKDCYPPPTALTSAARIKVGIPQHHDGFVDVPVLVENTTDVTSVQFSMNYNHDAFTLVDVRTAGLTDGFLNAFYEPDGALNVAMAGTESFSGNGRVAVVRFVKNSGPVPVASTRVSIVSALLNETAPTIAGQTYDAEIVRFGLGPVSPNPFSEGTAISYNAAKASHVSLAVYNVNGQLVRTLHDGHVEAGIHRVAWDGTDSNGVKVARGVYFCRMNADEFSATEKVVLLQ